MVEVTDHAVLRYMQRVMGMNVEELRSQIAAMLSFRVPAGLPDAVVTIDGISFTIQNGKLVTLFQRKSLQVRSELDHERK